MKMHVIGIKVSDIHPATVFFKVVCFILLCSQLRTYVCIHIIRTKLWI